ncbi:hypothetical protein CkaCkLH20_10460 [Colletotrichum karsti]|uniref:Uncharacterized protein n=1 Tax=Colletotrichum karsti TaxID=1095194 RepID=A0A9P6HVG6_9PEZI|nr:uncharacterized protein CkaCkLH20_10460 [Colletotrichum karsti]KAF9872123.1 hypothetical protein CkaCkLH20_10460 [Colletotrichum karsti]
MDQPHGPIAAPASGYECIIYVLNKTKVDLFLESSTVTHGSWAEENPPRIIKAGSEGLVQLNDNGGITGSKGEVFYKLVLPSQPDKPIFLKIEFCDPFFGWDSNYLRATASHPDVVSAYILDYAAAGHPFTGHVEIRLAEDQFDQDCGRDIFSRSIAQIDDKFASVAAEELNVGMAGKMALLDGESALTRHRGTRGWRFASARVFNGLHRRDVAGLQYLVGLFWMALVLFLVHLCKIYKME